MDRRRLKPSVNWVLPIFTTESACTLAGLMESNVEIYVEIVSLGLTRSAKEAITLTHRKADHLSAVIEWLCL